MRRLVLLGLILGALNAAAAVLVLYVTAPEVEAVGWFGYAPLGEDVTYDSPGPSWEYAVLPTVLVLLNAALLPLTARKLLAAQTGMTA